MSDRKFILFVKVGNQTHMEKLFHDGEVFCKTLKYFTEAEEENLRHDKHEGASYMTQMKKFEVFTEDGKTLIGTGDSGQLYFHHSRYQGNVFCLYGVETNTLSFETGKIRPFNLDISGVNFGDFAVVILNPGQFVNRVKREVEAKGLTFQYGAVDYYDEYTYQGELSPFHKSKKYVLQKEIRFWIPNALNEDLTVKIGNISDIARLLSKRDLMKLGYSPD